MHVAFVIYGSLDEISGGFLYDRHLVHHLQRRGHHVTVVAWPWRSYVRSLYDNFSHYVARQLGNNELDLILQDQLVHPSCFHLNRRLRRAVRTPIVSLIHLLRHSQSWPRWQHRLYHGVERRYLATVDGFIFVNRQIEARVHAMRAVMPPGVIAPPAGDHLDGALTPDDIWRRAQRSGPLKIAFVGNLTPLKGLHVVLQALAQMPRDSWCLTVMGSLDRDSSYVRRIRHEVAAQGWEGRVKLLGVVSQVEVSAHLAQSDLFAVPSNPESYSIAYLEAMSHGLPVVAHVQSDSAALVEPGISGFHMQPGDAQGLAGHLRALALDRPRLGHMSLAARKRFVSFPTWEQSMSRAVQFLEHMVADGRCA